MRWLKNLNLLPVRARFANVFIEVGSFGERGAERCLNNSCGTQKLALGGGYDDLHRFGLTAFTGHLILGSGAIGHTFGNSIRQEHSVSREWLAKRWVEEKRRKDIMRKRKRRYVQRVETKEPMLDASFKFPFMQSFFTRTIPVEQRWQTHEASLQPPTSQYEEGFLYPQTPEEENRYAMMDPCYPQSPVGFIREQSNLLMRQLLRTRRPFIAHITDAMGNEIFRVRRPFWWITSTIYAEVDGKEIGVVCRRWHLWKRIYDLYFGNKQFAVVENPGLWNWTFTLKDEDDNVLAQIDRDWRGFGLELFTDAGQYVIRFGNSYSSPKIGLASAVQELEVKRPLTLSERAVAVALAISLDNDFFSRTVGGWGLPIIVAGE